jgi:hypothetical protein
MLNFVMMNVILLNAVILNAVMLNVVMLSVVVLFENVIAIHECSYQQPSLLSCTDRYTSLYLDWLLL